MKAHLLAEEFDGASVALMPVLDTAPEHRVRPLLQRVGEISRMTANFERRDPMAVGEIRDAINEFSNVRACKSLPSC